MDINGKRGVRYLLLAGVSCLCACGQRAEQSVPPLDGTKQVLEQGIENKVSGKSQTPEGHMVVTCASGLKYEVLKQASNEAMQPKPGQTVTVHYTGWLEKKDEPGKPDEKAKFDSSVDRGEKFSFTVGIGQVIKGWDEGLLEMKIGEKRRLIIPSELGYGARGVGRVIPPHATLVFDVELFDVK